MSRSSNSCFSSLFCWGGPSSGYNTGDFNIKVSKRHMDEMLIEKIQAKATVQRLQNMNDKLNKNLAEIQAELEAREQEISRLEAIYGYKSLYRKTDQIQQHGDGDFYSHENRWITVHHMDGVIAKPCNSSLNQAGVTRFCNYTDNIDTRPPLTNKITPGVEFEKYLIKAGQGTRSWFRFPLIDKDGEIVSTDEIVTYIERERFSSWISFEQTDNDKMGDENINNENTDDKLNGTCNITAERINEIKTDRVPSWFSFQTDDNVNENDNIEPDMNEKLNKEYINKLDENQNEAKLFGNESNNSARSLVKCGTRVLGLKVGQPFQLNNTCNSCNITCADEGEDDDDECGFWFYK